MSTRARAGSEASSYSEGTKDRSEQAGQETYVSVVASPKACSRADVGPSGSLSVSQDSRRTPGYDEEVDKAKRTHNSPMLLPPLPYKLAETTRPHLHAIVEVYWTLPGHSQGSHVCIGIRSILRARPPSFTSGILE